VRFNNLFAGAVMALGLLGAASVAQADVNLITNGDFSAGGANWSVNSNAFTFNDEAYHEGAFAGAPDGTISQTFLDAVGGLLTLDFDYGGGDGFQYVSFNGIAVPGSFVSNPSAFTHYTFSLGAGTGSDTITFIGRNEPAFNTLDNVSVTQAAVPEPATWALMLSGFLGAGVALRSNRRRQVAFAA